jgi:hypothetical protein
MSGNLASSTKKIRLAEHGVRFGAHVQREGGQRYGISPARVDCSFLHDAQSFLFEPPESKDGTTLGSGLTRLEQGQSTYENGGMNSWVMPLSLHDHTIQLPTYAAHQLQRGSNVRS